ncbi:MAG: BolA/IbaG family iron-sulfur metabolism protein [Gammaproteobacteria bacterium]|nr:BolA/IbaG family iron-sulfur metabolism protein [Gammaproteobacteria bacterium]
MEIQEVEASLRANLQAHFVQLTTRDTVHFEAVIVSDDFMEVSRVKRQQRVYETLGPLIASGEMHAIALKLYTRSEWENKDQKNV